MNRAKLIEVVPESFPTTGFILKALENVGPWKDAEDVDEVALDLNFLLSHSGQKPVTNLAAYYVDTTGKIPASGVSAMANIIYQLYGKQWEKYYQVLLSEYDPIENYSMHEEIDIDESGKEKQEDSLTGTIQTQTVKTGTETHTNVASGTNKTETEHTGHDTVVNEGLKADNQSDSKIFGVNSTTGVPDRHIENSAKNTTTSTPGVKDTVTETPGQTDTLTITPNTTETITETPTNRKNTLEKSFEDRHTDRDTYRHGNIGVTTSVQMLSEHKDFWNGFSFWEMVYRDISKALCLDIYY